MEKQIVEADGTANHSLLSTSLLFLSSLMTFNPGSRFQGEQKNLWNVHLFLLFATSRIQVF